MEVRRRGSSGGRGVRRRGGSGGGRGGVRWTKVGQRRVRRRGFRRRGAPGGSRKIHRVPNESPRGQEKSDSGLKTCLRVPNNAPSQGSQKMPAGRNKPREIQKNDQPAVLSSFLPSSLLSLPSTLTLSKSDAAANSPTSQHWVRHHLDITTWAMMSTVSVLS